MGSDGAVRAPARQSSSSICAPASPLCRPRPVVAPNDRPALPTAATQSRNGRLRGAVVPSPQPVLCGDFAPAVAALGPTEPMESSDEDFEALRARYTSLRGSIENELRTFGSVPRPASPSERPRSPHAREEQYDSLRESLVGNFASARENQPQPCVDSAIESQMSAQFAALRTSVSTGNDMATRPRTAPIVSAATSIDRYRPASGLEMSWTDPAPDLPSPAAASVEGVDHASVLVHAERPACGPMPTLLTALDVARRNASCRSLAPRCHNGQSATSSPRHKPSAAIDPYRAHDIIFGHEAMRAALASHRRHYLESRDALRPTRKSKNHEAGHGDIVSARSDSQPTPVIAATSADRRSSGRRAVVQQLTSTLTPNRASKAVASMSARSTTRKVPLARPASAGATPRAMPTADLVQVASQGVGDPRQAQVVASIKQRSETIHRNSVATPR
jgi:hypothetical protein